MTGKLPALLLLAPALLLGQDLQPATPAGKPKRKNPLTALLQPNSVLSGVLLPWYDENRRLSGVFRAKTVTLITQDILDGKSITVDLFNPDRSPRGRLDLTQALYNQVTGKVHSTDTTKLTLDNMTTTGTGLVFVVDQSEGFLTGPVTTRIKPRPKTAMRSSSTSLPAALLGASLLALPPAAESATPPPAAPPPAAVEPPAATAAAQMAAANAETRDHLRTALNASTAATEAATKFLEAEELLAKTAAATPPAAPEPKALDVEPGLDDTVINCDGGMYFHSEKVEKGADVEKGVLVYLGNVTVTKTNDYEMTGANELKAFFTKKPAPEKAAPAPKADGKAPAPSDEANAKWELDRVVATGAVNFKKYPTKEGDEPIEASGAIFTYNRESGAITLSGGKPWVRQGGNISRAKRAEQTITITKKSPDPDSPYNAASFSPGGAETIIRDIQQLQEKDKKKDK